MMQLTTAHRNEKPLRYPHAASFELVHIHDEINNDATTLFIKSTYDQINNHAKTVTIIESFLLSQIAHTQLLE